MGSIILLLLLQLELDNLCFRSTLEWTHVPSLELQLVNEQGIYACLFELRRAKGGIVALVVSSSYSLPLLLLLTFSLLSSRLVEEAPNSIMAFLPANIRSLMSVSTGRERTERMNSSPVLVAATSVVNC